MYRDNCQKVNTKKYNLIVKVWFIWSLENRFSLYLTFSRSLQKNENEKVVYLKKIKPWEQWEFVEIFEKLEFFFKKNFCFIHFFSMLEQKEQFFKKMSDFFNFQIKLRIEDSEILERLLSSDKQINTLSSENENKTNNLVFIY